ncbi:glycosyltransferase [Candidatus Falkowbacteria bacterium]|nr:glycosyltransferase [Candidatus Falkowbacteria bacterium]
MKICVISNLYPPEARGGAERVAKTIADGFSAASNEVSVVSTKTGRGLTTEIVEGIKVYRFKPMNLFYYLDDERYSVCWRFFWRLFDTFNLHSAFVVWRILKKERPQIVITHNLVGIGLLIPSVVKILKIRHCHILHDVQLVAPSGIILKGKENDFLTNGWLARVYAAICKILFGSPFMIISPSRWLMNFYVSKGFFQSSKRIILPNPIRRLEQEIPEKTALSGSFLFLGQLKEHKGIHWLINLWQKNNIQNKLLVAGSGKEQRGGGNIQLVGDVDESSLNKIFVQADFLIVPSICYENSPTVILLAFLYGVPVIAANIGGAAELVENGKNGFVFDAENEQEFLKALNAARGMTLPAWNAMSRACQEKSKTFLIDDYIEKLYAAINQSFN